MVEKEIAVKTKVRQSNIELLRIIAMFFVLIGHANGVVMGMLSPVEIETATLSSFIRILFMSIAIGGVNIFVLISGWFGVRANYRGLAKLLFQFFFLLWGRYIVAVLRGETTFDSQGIRISMGLTQEYWFVMGYLGLYILSPVLNAFVEKVNKRLFQMFLITFYIYQCYYCWITGVVNYFGGYSIIFFCGLYLTARYFRLYPSGRLNRLSLYVYIAITCFISIIVVLSVWKFGNAMKMLRYDNPLIILSSMALLLFFCKFRFQSPVVNWLAASSFAVYIVHFNPYVFKFFKRGVLYFTSTLDGGLLVLGIFLFLSAVYLFCVFIDQIRIGMWNLLQHNIYQQK